MCFWTTWSILLDNRFKELETTCTKLSWKGIKEIRIQCLFPTESILLQHSDSTPMLSLSDCTKKVSKALAVLMGTYLQRASCEAHACAQLRGLIIITCPLKHWNPSPRSKSLPEFSADPTQSVKFYFLVQVEVGRLWLLCSITFCLALICLYHRITKSQNHRTARVGSDLKGHLVPIPWRGQVWQSTDQATQVQSRLALNISRDGALTNSLWNLFA